MKSSSHSTRYKSTRTLIPSYCSQTKKQSSLTIEALRLGNESDKSPSAGGESSAAIEWDMQLVSTRSALSQLLNAGLQRAQATEDVEPRIARGCRGEKTTGAAVCGFTDLASWLQERWLDMLPGPGAQAASSSGRSDQRRGAEENCDRLHRWRGRGGRAGGRGEAKSLRHSDEATIGHWTMAHRHDREAVVQLRADEAGTRRVSEGVLLCLMDSRHLALTQARCEFEMSKMQ